MYTLTDRQTVPAVWHGHDKNQNKLCLVSQPRGYFLNNYLTGFDFGNLVDLYNDLFILNTLVWF